MMLIVPDPDSVDPQALAERRRKKARRRAALWGAFLLLGLALGTIYATGFATNTGTTDIPGSGPSPAGGMEAGANQDTSALANAVASPGSLEYTWTGRWGSFETDQVLFSVDLDTAGVASGNYFVELLLDDPLPAGFADLQIEFTLADDGGDGCTAADLAGGTQRVMIFDNEDDQVSWDTLAGGNAGDGYCVGVLTADGKDTSGTFIRKVNSGQTFPASPAGEYPTFIATVNRES